MPLPVPEKTWQFNVNYPLYSTGDEYNNSKTFLINIKNILKGFALNPWVVTGSSDGLDLASGMDGVDRWNTITDIRTAAAGSNHSWIVLKQAAIHANYEICIDMSYTNTRFCTIVFGTTGFTGGSRTARPTATLQTILNNNTYWYPNSVANWILQVMMSTDGECTRVIMLQDRVASLFWLFDKPKNPVAGWVNPGIATTLGDNGNSTKCSLSWFNDNAIIRGFPGGVAATMYTTFEGYGAATVLENLLMRNQITNEFQLFPPGLASLTTNARGRHGEIFDFWMGPLSANASGGYSDQTYPNNTSRQWWQVDDVVLPWPGTPTVPGPVPIVAL